MEAVLFIEHFWTRNSLLARFTYIVLQFFFYILEVSCYTCSCAGKGSEVITVYVTIVVSLFCRAVAVLALVLIQKKLPLNHRTTVTSSLSLVISHVLWQTETVVFCKAFRCNFNWFYALVLSLRLCGFSHYYSAILESSLSSSWISLSTETCDGLCV